MAARIAIIAMTTSSSISVKACRFVGVGADRFRSHRSEFFIVFRACAAWTLGASGSSNLVRRAVAGARTCKAGLKVLFVLFVTEAILPVTECEVTAHVREHAQQVTRGERALATLERFARTLRPQLAVSAASPDQKGRAPGGVVSRRRRQM